MQDPTATPVSARYGAPMGRPELTGEPTGPVHVFRVKLTDGYDHGGAYWGCGAPLYCATDGDALRLFQSKSDFVYKLFEIFVRKSESLTARMS